MKKAKLKIVLIAISAIIISLFCIDAMTDNPKTRVQNFANESVVRSVAPFID